jgi:hypothetical protein
MVDADDFTIPQGVDPGELSGGYDRRGFDGVRLSLAVGDSPLLAAGSFKPTSMLNVSPKKVKETKGLKSVLQ